MKAGSANTLLFAVGLVCVIFYVLTSLRGVSPPLVRAGGILFYAGLLVLFVGLVLRLRAGETLESDMRTQA